MFEGRKKIYNIEAPVYKEDSFNYEKVSYIDKGVAAIYIVVEDRTGMTVNEIDVYKTTLVGYTNDEVKKDYLIDGKYKVTSTVPHRNGLVLYLQEIENGRE